MKCQYTFDHLIIHSFFAGKHDVKYVGAVLEPFWASFDSSIPVEHVKNAILGVPKNTQN